MVERAGKSIFPSWRGKLSGWAMLAIAIPVAAVIIAVVVTRQLDRQKDDHDIALIRANIDNIRWLDHPSENVQVIAARNGGFLQLLDAGIKPTEAVQFAAVKNDGKNLAIILDKGLKPSNLVAVEGLKTAGSLLSRIDHPTEEMQAAAVSSDSSALFILLDKGIIPSETVLIAAVKASPGLIGDIIKRKLHPSEKLMLEAVTSDDGDVALKSILDSGIHPSTEVQRIAVNKSYDAFDVLIRAGMRPTYDVQLAAVRAFAENIEEIDAPSEELQLIAAKDFNIAEEYLNGGQIFDWGFKAKANLKFSEKAKSKMLETVFANGDRCNLEKRRKGETCGEAIVKNMIYRKYNFTPDMTHWLDQYHAEWRTWTGESLQECEMAISGCGSETSIERN